jgi:hypothetical protein
MHKAKLPERIMAGIIASDNSELMDCGWEALTLAAEEAFAVLLE